MKNPVSVRAVVHGRVQGVFYRAFVEEHAQQLDIVGYVRNLSSGAVEVMAEGDRENLEKLVRYLEKGPPVAIVDRVDITWSEYTGDHSGFVVRY